MGPLDYTQQSRVNASGFLPYLLFVGVWPAFIIDRVALAKQRDNRIGSVHPSVRPFACGCVCVSVGMFVRALPAKPFDL